MKTAPATRKPDANQLAWRKIVAQYEHPSVWRSGWQVVNSLFLYFLFWYLMYLSLNISYWLTLALAIPAAGLLVRSFIILHDCGHGSFFKSQKVNVILGGVVGVLTFTPFYYWRHDHAVHHATAGDLDRRIVGDIWTMTVKEYLASSPWKRFAYRLYRNPLVMFGLGPIFLFLITYRFARPAANKRERHSVYRTSLVILGIGVLMSVTIGLRNYVLVQLPIMMIASSAGVWMFYVQHQFEEVYWERHENWDYVAVALQGSSFYKLPKVLQWFTGNIGFHHIHHLSPRIPNYYLEKCYKENPMFQRMKQITLRSSLKTLSLRLWDEDSRKLVGYGAINARGDRQALKSGRRRSAQEKI
ncbi:MAG: fatty acid desaturase [bacterium]